MPSAKVVMTDHSYQTFPSAVILQKSTWTFAAAGTMTGWRRGKNIGNQLNIPGVRERGLIDPHVTVEHALKVPREPVDHHSLLDHQDHASPPSVVVVGYRSESGRMSARLGWSNRHRYCGSPICALA